jgi:competence protein ComGC
MKNNQAASFVMIMIIVGLTSLLLSIAIKQIIKIQISDNESNAAGTLKLISTAMENYADAHQGAYPKAISALTQTNPAYIDKNYISLSPIKGYNYSCSRLEPAGYSCSASPAKCSQTGKTTYTITTGGALASQECSVKE